MSSSTNPTEESFLKDVEKHEVTVLVDNGVYRHLRCATPKTGVRHFNIVTFPGYLCYSGDMGCFVFSRLPDMFEFFRSDREPGRLGINRPYWGEKLEAVDRDGRSGSFMEFSEPRMRQHVEEVVAEWIENCDVPYDASPEDEAEAREKFASEIRKAVEEGVYLYFGDGEHEARKAVSDFSYSKDRYRGDPKPVKYEFHDSWEWSCSEFTFHFTWCCYALAWAIQKYDAMKDAAEDLFYIQDSRSFVGNSVLWWRVDGAGYTSDLTQAWKVPREKALRMIGSRSTDIAWPCAVIDAKAQHHFDMQHSVDLTPLVRDPAVEPQPQKAS